MLRQLPVVAVWLQSGRGRVQAVPWHLMVPGTAGVAAQPIGLWRHGPLSNFVWFFAEEIYVKHFIIQGRGLELLIKWR